MLERTVVDPLAGTSWVLVELTARELLPHRRVSLTFAENGTVGGTDGCNHFHVPYTLDPRGLRFADSIATTMTGCPAAVGGQAAAYLDALKTTAAYDARDGLLRLMDGTGAVTMTFVPSDRVLPGSSWIVTGYHDGKQGMVRVLPGTEVTANFQENGRLTGSAGCNNYVADFDSESYAISVGLPRATRKHCGAPSGVMEQERHFLAALYSAVNVWIDGDVLELRTDAGALAVTLRRQAP